MVPRDQQGRIWTQTQNRGSRVKLHSEFSRLVTVTHFLDLVREWKDYNIWNGTVGFLRWYVADISGPLRDGANRTQPSRYGANGNGPP